MCSGHDCWGRYEFDDIYVVTDEDGNYFTCELIKYKTREMTLEEIEDKLGYKVKIVENK